jgi:uncharacterized membrane protein
MDAIMNLLGNFDPSALLPNISFTFGLITLLARLAILVVPALLLAFGALYFFKPVKEPSRKSGYRTIFAIKDPEAWRFVQRLAGFVYLILGGVMMLAMLIVSIILIWKDTMALLTITAICLVIEAILIALATLGINIFMAVRHQQNSRQMQQRNQRAPQRTPQRAPQRVPRKK